MSKPLKSLRTNMMYWRFRYITRNRLRFQSWLARRRQPRTARTFRPRGTAARVYYRTGRRTWVAVLGMVVLLTALRVYGDYNYVAPYLDYGLRMAIILGSIYWALLGV